MINSVTRWLALAGVLLVALALRTYQLERRPMHADEANQAVKAGELIAGGHYTFDPRDHHGPTLYFATVPVAWVRGESTLATLTETTVRVVPAFFGTVCVLMLALAGGKTNRGTALLAAALLAVSPPAVYYARYYIQETLLVAFFLLGVVASQRWWESGRARWAVAAGAAAGLMVATKETAVVLILAALVAARVARPGRPATLDRAGFIRAAWFALGTGLIVAALLYSSLGRDVAGLRNAVLAPFHGWHRAVDGSGHEKPGWYYLRLLTWIRAGGLVWEQVLFTFLALLGVVTGFRRPAVRGAAVYAALVLLLFSAVPYKTPWNLLHVLPPLAYLAASGLVALAGLRTGRVVAAAFAFLTFAMLAAQTRLIAFRRSADARNPYAYVHSSPDVLRYRALADAAVAAAPGQPVRVISEEYWPLPWYLRAVPNVGYWNAPPENCDGALVIASADLAETVRSRLQGPYHASFLGLRPGFVCVVFTPEAAK